MKIVFAICLFAIIAFVCGCESDVKNHDKIYKQKNQSIEISEKDTFAEEESRLDNISLLMKKLSIDKDCAEGIIEELERVGMTSPIKKVKKLDSKKGISANIIDNNKKKYYIGLGELGYLEIIREDTIDGPILFATMD